MAHSDKDQDLEEAPDCANRSIAELPEAAAAVQDPYAWYEQLRAGAISRLSAFGGSWVVARHAEAAGLLRDRRLSVQRSSALFEALPAENRDEFADFARLFSKWMIFLEGPQHELLRQALAAGFSELSVDAMRSRIAANVRSLVDQAASRGDVDLIRDLAGPLPAIVIADLLGVPHSDQGRLIRWSEQIARFFGAANASVDIVRSALVGLVEMVDYFEQAIRLERVRGSLAKKILQLHHSGDIGADVVYAQCAMLLFAGHETTKNLIGNGLHLLLTHGDQFTRLRCEPHLARLAVHEVLRFETPVQIASRAAAERMTINDHVIQSGELVVFLLGAANRDEREFHQPDRFDIARSPNRHLAFGHGFRACLGAQLACLECETVFSMLTERYPGLRGLADHPDWLPSFGFRGLASLPVLLDATRQERKAASHT